MPRVATKIRTGTKLVHNYEPRGGCKEVMECRDDEVLISGPAGTGKSRACLEKILFTCLQTPNTRALILRKTLTSLGSTALVTWRNYVAKEALAVGDVVYYGGSSQEAPQYRFSNGSSVTIGGLDKPTRIMSAEYDLVYIQEATEITVEDLEFVKTRLRNWQTSFQQIVMDCNPAGDKHWLKLRCNDKIAKLIETRHEDNPRLFTLDGELTVPYGVKYMQILDSLTGVRYKRLRLGLWVSAVGIVYEEFDPAYHVLPWDYDENDQRLPLPVDWARYWVIDFGYVHPFVCKWYAEDPESGALFMYREVYMTQRTVEEHTKTIMECVTQTIENKWYDHFNKIERVEKKTVWTEPKPTAIICDHDLQARRTFEKATGLGTQAAIKDVWEGINLHKTRLKNDLFFYMADALVEKDETQSEKLLPWRSQDEYASYVWKVNIDGRTQDEPVKQDDDGVDCDRYMTAFLDFKGKARGTQL